jgi:Rad3-related DNA helicase
MVGLPFANMGSVELRERMKYVEGLPNAGKSAGQELYEVSMHISLAITLGDSLFRRTFVCEL